MRRWKKYQFCERQAISQRGGERARESWGAHNNPLPSQARTLRALSDKSESGRESERARECITHHWPLKRG
eukprot:1378628-Amorphochlora_amoeboformis.AAC.1